MDGLRSMTRMNMNMTLFEDKIGTAPKLKALLTSLVSSSYHQSIFVVCLFVFYLFTFFNSIAVMLLNQQEHDNTYILAAVINQFDEVLWTMNTAAEVEEKLPSWSSPLQ